MSEERSWIRAAMGLLALGHLVAGVWGVVDPLSWYESFPGLGRRWNFGDGPFNRHLSTDTAAGFVAIGVVLVFSILLARRDAMKVALAGYLVQVTPHFIYHLVRGGAPLGALDAVLSLTVLGGQVVVASVVLVALYRAAAPGSAVAGAAQREPAAGRRGDRL